MSVSLRYVGPSAACEDRRILADAFRRDGYLVVENVLSADFVAELRREFATLLDEKVRRFALEPSRREQPSSHDAVLNEFVPDGGNHDVNRWNMHLPSREPFFDERLIANETVVAVVDDVLGDDWVMYLAASDTPYPGSTVQSMHQDFAQFSIAVNVSLVDFSEQNGPIEVWPGTHRPDVGGDPARFSAVPYRISSERMRQLRATVQPKRLLLPAGAMLIRDHRLVHRGTANRSSEPRLNLSMYYVRPAAVPYRCLADAGAAFALALRRFGRGRGPRVQRRAVFEIGNILGRSVEEASLSDRDYRRPIPAALWDGFTPETRQRLRFASIGRGARSPRAGHGSLAGCGRLIARMCGAGWNFASARLLRRPRNA